MTGTRKRDGDSEGDSGFVTPDSTTREKVIRFSEGNDVLSHGKDGLYYLGTIVEVDTKNERCLIQFDDSTAHWSLYKDITKLKLPESDDLCVVCKSSKSLDTNEIVLCHICEQGYHQKCLKPNISPVFCEPDSQWECPQCADNSVVEKEEKRKSKESSPRKQRPKRTQHEDQHKKKLPYDVNSLVWDKGHKTNKEETYCYCGGPGEWYNRMLQCQRCKQWFHEACVECLHYPLLLGDRFYVFVCSLCNGGLEFIHRLDVTWIDVVHITIFNLTLQDSKTYFEYNFHITQWINENWEYLQAPLKLQNLPVDQRFIEVLKILEGNRPRFKCGRECKKKRSLWGLRARVPPPIPSFTVPPSGPLTEHSITKSSVRTRKDRYGYSPPIPRSYKLKDDSKFILEEHELHSRYSPAKKRVISPGSLGKEDEENRVTFFAEGDNKIQCSNRRQRKRELDMLMEDKKAKKMIEELNNSKLPFASPETRIHSLKRKRGRPPKPDSSNGGLPNQEKLKVLKQREAQRILKVAIQQGKTHKNQKKKIGFSAVLGDTSGDETSSRGTLESFIPAPSNFEGQNNPFLNLDSAPLGLAVIRSLKRKLSANDIRIGKNGEIKKRRYRKKRLLQLLQQTNSVGLGLSGSVKNCFDFTSGSRLIKNELDSTVRVNGKVGENAISLSDLKLTVNDYFGATTRIACGEKFKVHGKRILSGNVIQYLIEWEAPS